MFKKILLLATPVLLAVFAAHGQTSSTFDQYGGRMDLNCQTITSYFHLEKIGNRWWFCTPEGHAFTSMSVGGVSGNSESDCQGRPSGPHVVAKYGDQSYNWGWQTLKRLTTWGFNTIGQDSVSHVSPFDTCSDCSWPGHKQPIQVPFIVEMKPAEYAFVNQFGYLTSPLKDIIAGTNRHYNGWRGGALPDVFDPALSTEFRRELAVTGVDHPTPALIRNNYSYLLGVFTDDSDFFSGSSGAGPDFPTGPPGHSGANSAFLTLITSPVQTYIEATSFGGHKFVYTTQQNFTKTLSTNPILPCSVANPCSLLDYLQQKYMYSISRLNAKWGSDYTTFGTTGKQITSELIGLGNGARTTFTHTLLSGGKAISPFSVLISVGGVARIGDCPGFHAACLDSKPNSGTLGSPANMTVQATSAIDYATGLVTLNFVTAPAAGVRITANYISGGWMAGGTGLMDEDGSHAWVGTNPWCLEGPNPSYPTDFVCNGGVMPLPNANPALGADLDNWIPQLAAKYFQTMRLNLTAAGSKVPYLGLDIMGGWGAPAYSKFLQGASPYVDAGFVVLKTWLPAPSPTAFESAYQYITQYFGDKPLLDFLGVWAQSDSSYGACFPLPATDPNNFPDQAIRGRQYFNTVQYLLTNPGHNATIPFVGFGWWAWQDSKGLNMGLVSIHDNAYDGRESVTGAVLCDSYYSVLPGAFCGREAANYGDVITQVKAANRLWTK
jgi:hypothetical protein